MKIIRNGVCYIEREDIDFIGVLPQNICSVIQWDVYYSIKFKLLKLKDKESAQYFSDKDFILDYDMVKDLSTQELEEMRKEIESGCFGPDIREQWIKLTRTQQSETLRNLYRFYGQRQEIVSFVYEVQMLIPGSVLFRHRKFPRELYVYVRKEKTMELEQKIHLAEQLFLPIYYTLQTAWDTPFLISDLTVIVQKGNQIAK